MPKPMNPKIKAKWVAALRSGKYKQGKGQLRDKDNNFCCLGVLCDLHAQAHPKIAAQQTDLVRYCGAISLPPAEVVEWAGLVERMNRIVIIGGVAASMARHNDEGSTFAEIADAIEAQL